MTTSWLLQPSSRAMLVLLSALAALGPLATDLYLPALPLLTEVFSTNLSSVQLTMSAYLVGFALCHLVCGPAADRFGRKPVLVVGFGLFFLGCLGCSFSTDVEQLIAWRFLQGAGACTGSTLCRTFIRDAYHKDKTASAMGTMTAIMAVAPIIAPSIGGLILLYIHWRGIFGFLVIYSGLGLLAILFLLPETLKENYRQRFDLPAIVSNYRELIASRSFVYCVLGSSFMFAGFFAYITGASFVLIGFMGVPIKVFGLWFIMSALGYMAGSFCAGGLAQKIAVRHLVFGTALLTFLAGLIMSLLLYCQFYHPLAILGPMMLYCFAMGVVFPNAIADALSGFPHIAGTASALLGFSQMIFSAIASGILGVLMADNPLAMACLIMIFGGLGSVFFFLLKRLH